MSDRDGHLTLQFSLVEEVVLIQELQQLSSRLASSAVARCRNSAIRSVKHADALTEALELLQGRVGGSIVDYDDFHRSIDLPQSTIDSRSNELCSVEGRNDDADERLAHAVPAGR
jgi:hypothetical protein